MGAGGSFKASACKAAAVKIRAWLDNLDGNVIPVEELELIQRHYHYLTRQKVSRKGRYVKGRSYEYEIRDYFIGRGLACRRVIQSGGGTEKDDLVLKSGFGNEFRLELKRVAKLPAYLVNEADATIFREDRGETYVLTRLNHYADLLQ